MQFLTYNSINFCLFLFIITIIYFLIPQKFRWMVLLAASMVFYISAGIEKLPFIVLTSLIVFLSARRLNNVYEAAEREADEQGLKGRERMEFLAPTKKKCKVLYLMPTLLLVVGILCYCKFAARLFDFLYDHISFWTVLDVIVPLGVSYYTFSSVGYLLDIYWRKQKPMDN